MIDDLLPDLGHVSIRAIDSSVPRPHVTNIYSNWGEIAPEVKNLGISRWLIELTKSDGEVVPVGELDAHAVWYGPSPSSRAMNIGIQLVESYRGLGIGTIAQRLLAAELHRRGVVRVEAGTDVTNIAEQRSLEKAGFVYEGTLRSAQGRADGLHDLQVWSHIQIQDGSNS